MSNIQITENESGKYSPEWFYNEAQKPEWIAFIRKADTLHENFINHFGIEHLKSLSGKELLKSNKKYYIVDLGIRNYILPKKRYDLGFSIENIVYFELHRRGYEVYIGKNKNLEVDFIAKKNNEYTYIQVTASMLEESTFEREITPLREIRDNYPKIILTLDEFTVGNYEGIKVINVIDWLLEE